MTGVALGFSSPLAFLAFDHRGEFARSVLDVEGEPTPEQDAVIADCKQLIFEGVLLAARSGVVPAGEAGILVDELYGADVARRALAAGVVVAMPIEAPDRAVFDFAYGADWRAHVEAFEPTFAKVLVRYNPDGSAEENAVQHERLAELSAWVRSTDRNLLFELIVVPTEEQLASVDGSRERFARELRPRLIVRSIAALQAAGVEPDLWKLEGLYDVLDAKAVVEQARSGEGREQVACTILGAGAPDETVDHWLSVAAAVPGFTGFAIGRSIWRDAVRAVLANTLSRDDAAQRIADNYLRFVRVFTSATDDVTTPA